MACESGHCDNFLPPVALHILASIHSVPLLCEFIRVGRGVPDEPRAVIVVRERNRLTGTVRPTILTGGMLRSPFSLVQRKKRCVPA